MDALQDQADVNLIIISANYLQSKYCLHEMERAIARDPLFDRGEVVFVLRETCPLPDAITEPDPLLVNLQDDSKSNEWDRLMESCEADLGTDVPTWFQASEETRLHVLMRNQSVNLTTFGNARWKGIVTNVLRVPMVDLQHPLTRKTTGLAQAICEALDGPTARAVRSLDDLFDMLDGRPISHLALTHFDLARSRRYPIDLFNTLRYHVMDSRKLVVLIQSKRAFGELLPSDNPLSTIDVKTVELRGRK